MRDPSTPAALDVRGLCKRYPGVVALDRVDLCAHRHEVHALIGENGAGKSTLMKILAGALQADAGEVFMAGRAVRIRSPRDSRRLGISPVPQDVCVVPNLSAAENIHLGTQQRWPPLVNWSHVHEAAAAALERIGARFDPRTPAWQLSLAQQQLVVIARAIAQGGQVLVLDEPTSSLGGRDAEKLLDVVCQLREEGLAIVYISHRLNEIYSLADRVTVLHDGCVVGRLDGEDISTDRVLDLMSPGRAGRAGRVEPHRAAARAAGAALVEVRGLTDGGRIRPASFCIAGGEVVGLTGLVGSGRSSLSRLLCGADRRSGGEILVEGRRCLFRSPADAIRQGIAYVPECRGDEGLFPRMSPSDNVTLGVASEHLRLGLFCDDAELARRCDEALRRLRLTPPASGMWATELSGGARQKLVLARGLVTGPKLLILDEPTTGLEAAAKADVESLVRELAAAGTAVLWICADVADVVRVCDRALVMYEGDIVGALDPAVGDVFSEERLLAYATGLRRDDERAPAWPS